MNQRFWTVLLAVLSTAGMGMASSSYARSTPFGVASKPVQAEESAPGAQAQPSKEAIEAGIAKIYAYELAGRQAATLYVRSIPILTFLSAGAVESSDTAIADDPVLRATAVATKINQLSRDNVDASLITVSWKAKCKCYAIKANDEELVEIDAKTILADTTRKLALDALQATNRLRRLIGNAPPLPRIAGKPVEKFRQISVLTVRFQIRGIASWYGPGFNGNRSASGEIFNQNAMTAAHRSLPFGTKVRVTNLNNGRSVVVRINDRGPFIRGRVVDLSYGAARVLEMMGSGVAPVRIDVLGIQQVAVIDED